MIWFLCSEMRVLRHLLVWPTYNALHFLQSILYYKLHSWLEWDVGRVSFWTLINLLSLLTPLYAMRTKGNFLMKFLISEIFYQNSFIRNRGNDRYREKLLFLLSLLRSVHYVRKIQMLCSLTDQTYYEVSFNRWKD